MRQWSHGRAPSRPPDRAASRRTRASAAVRGDRPTKVEPLESPPDLSRIAGRRFGEDQGLFCGLAYSDDGFGSRDGGGPQRHMRVARSGLELRGGVCAVHFGAYQRRA